MFTTIHDSASTSALRPLDVPAALNVERADHLALDRTLFGSKLPSQEETHGLMNRADHAMFHSEELLKTCFRTRKDLRDAVDDRYGQHPEHRDGLTIPAIDGVSDELRVSFVFKHDCLRAWAAELGESSQPPLTTSQLSRRCHSRSSWRRTGCGPTVTI